MNAELLAPQRDRPEARHVAYERERLDVLLYRWIDGIDVAAAMLGGGLTQAQMVALGQQSRLALRRHGWMACDHRSRHVIIRPHKAGDAYVRRHGEIKCKWALIDDELLVRV